ncbi:hypothetical protein Tco_0815277 [Tanacetum coccineum]
MYTSATHNANMEVGGKDRVPMLVARSYAQPTIRGLKTYSSMSPEKQKLTNAEAEAVHIILTWMITILTQ